MRIHRLSPTHSRRAAPVPVWFLVPTVTSLELKDLTAEPVRQVMLSLHFEIFVERPLCVRHCSGHKRCSGAQKSPPSALVGLDFQ